MSDLKLLFSQYPNAKELYTDSNGITWLSRETAESQSKGEKITVTKRSDILKQKTND